MRLDEVPGGQNDKAVEYCGHSPSGAGGGGE